MVKLLPKYLDTKAFRVVTGGPVETERLLKVASSARALCSIRNLHCGWTLRCSGTSSSSRAPSAWPRSCRVSSSTLRALFSRLDMVRLRSFCAQRRRLNS
eukprot:2712910-Rhodomonas_salina.1